MPTKEKRPKRTRAITPPGIAVWPKLTMPDYTYKEEGEYRTKLRFLPTDPGFPELIALLDAEHEKAFSEESAKFHEDPKNKLKEVRKAEPPYKVVVDDKGDPTGELEIGFGMKAMFKGKDGTEYHPKPGIFDAAGNPFPKSVGGGSKIRVSFEVRPYFVASSKQAGCSCALRAVQVLDWVEFSRGTASSYGFGKEDGFTYAPEEPEASSEGAPAGVAVSTNPDDQKDF